VGAGPNGWSNPYYSAAVRSMSSSRHNFLQRSTERVGMQDGSVGRAR
jgi:hypothetical protein